MATCSGQFLKIDERDIGLTVECWWQGDGLYYAAVIKKVASCSARVQVKFLEYNWCSWVPMSHLRAKPLPKLLGATTPAPTKQRVHKKARHYVQYEADQDQIVVDDSRSTWSVQPWHFSNIDFLDIMAQEVCTVMDSSGQLWIMFAWSAAGLSENDLQPSACLEELNRTCSEYFSQHGSELSDFKDPDVSYMLQ